MGHTNSTANLALPQFIGTDKPTWLGDINGAFSAIDSYAGTNDAAVAAAASDASSAISQASAAVNTANTANTTAGNASTAANNAVGVANTANAIAGTVDAKVGLLANLNTTDRTSIVNAINEVNGYNVPQIASVTADGAKDAQTLLHDVYTALASAVGTDAVKIYYLASDYSGSEVIYPAVDQSVHAALPSSIPFSRTEAVSAGDVVISALTANTNLANCHQNYTQFTSNAVAGPNNQDSMVITSGYTYKIAYSVF